MNTPESLRQRYNIQRIARDFSITEDEVITALLSEESPTSDPMTKAERGRVLAALQVNPFPMYEEGVIKYLLIRQLQPDFDPETKSIAIRHLTLIALRYQILTPKLEAACT